MTHQTISQVNLLVSDYDVALHFYTKQLMWDVIEDNTLANGKRRIVVKPPSRHGNDATGLVFSKVSPDEVGNQAADKVFLFINTDDVERDYQTYLKNGVVFKEPPTVKPHGKVAIFLDVFGNAFDLIQKHTDSLETRRNNMIRSLFDFLLDDCYVYLMTVERTAFLAHKEKGKSFYVMSMCLSHEFATRIRKIYGEMNIENPAKLVEDKYFEIVQKTIKTINSEDHDFVVSFNNKVNTVEYEILFINKN